MAKKQTMSYGRYLGWVAFSFLVGLPLAILLIWGIVGAVTGSNP